ncbi:uncharacterized protein LOC143854424 [Tasmannia lanceolata]|uniref:uncharacterized protein LOC143854424 n=1 Tax=Tasmannia lanceolata TaxID=3420 RepID=UPI004063763A
MGNFWDKYPKLWSEWDKKEKEWNQWEIRIFVLWSLMLQIILILFSPLRKRKATKWVTLFIWSTYLLADWVADFALGLLSNSQGDTGCDNNRNLTNKMKISSSTKRYSINNNNGLIAFWAPFLLLHLGGPDTITAFALEDNELWLRHLLGLGFEFMAAAYVFFRSIPHNKFLVPTLLMFVGGMIKYGERTCALYLASMDGFRNSMLGKPDPGPNYAKLMEEYASRKEADLPAEIEIKSEPKKGSTAIDVKDENTTEIANEVDAILPAHGFFDTFKGLIVDLIFSFNERDKSRAFYLKLTAQSAFKVVEIELSFVYEVLYTKAVVVHSTCGYVLRIVSSSAIILAFLFFFFLDKSGFNKLDKAISYSLLIGAMSLDAIALSRVILSDWTVVSLQKYPRLIKIASKIAEFIKKLLTSCPSIIIKILFSILPFRLNKPRWSASISQSNLIEFCLHDRETFFGKITSLFCMKDLLDEWRYTSLLDISEDMKKFIFHELKEKAKIAKDSTVATELCSSRGDLALKNFPDVLSNKYIHRSVNVVDVEFDESLLLWHIATDLCYNNNAEETIDKESQIKDHADETIGKDSEIKDEHRRFSNILSNYMIYLLVWQPNMMPSTAGIGQIRYRDTCAEAKRFFLPRVSRQPKFVFRNKKKIELESQHSQACNDLLSVNTYVDPKDVKGDRSKSVLFDACILAKELNKLEEGKRWEMMSKVWVEMLGYAASKCRGHYHAQRLSKGGELITFVWFLMAHLGLGEQYRIVAGQARARLIVQE